MNWYNMSFEEIERYVRNANKVACYDLTQALIDKHNDLLLELDECKVNSENTIDELKTQLWELKDEIRTIIS